MSLLLKIFNLMACTYLVSGYFLNNLDGRRGLVKSTIYDAMENVAKGFNTVMADLGDNQSAVGPEQVHLGKILNVIRELSHAAHMNPYEQDNNYPEIVAKAHGAHLPHIREAFKQEMEKAKTLQLNLIQQSIDVICRSLNRPQCTEEVDNFFYKTVPKMDEYNRWKYENAMTALYSLESSFKHLLSLTYETMKQFAQESNSALYVYSHRNTIDSLVDEWVETLRAMHSDDLTSKDPKTSLTKDVPIF